MGWAKPGPSSPWAEIVIGTHGPKWAEFKTKRKLSKLLSQ
ncbi:unnamed protein product, partial [Rotaria sp. Silwood2]